MAVINLEDDKKSEQLRIIQDFINQGQFNSKSTTDVFEDLKTLDISTSPTGYIFKIPEIPRSENGKSYTPIAFSIGLWNWDKIPTLQANDKFKVLYMRDLFIHTHKKLEEWNEKLSKIKMEFLNSYGESKAPKNLMFMMALDGCFIIEFLLKLNNKYLRSGNDPIFSYMLPFLYHDLLLLENQIPWSLLQTLYDHTTAAHASTQEKLVEHVTKLLGRIFPWMPKVDVRNQEPKHILDLLRLLLVNPIHQEEEGEAKMISNASLSIGINEESESDENKGWKPIPSATFLQRAGVQIKKKKKKSYKSILQVTFDEDKGVLEIPPLEFRQGTEDIFRNLICLEQRLPNCPHVITSYVTLIGCLINTSNDFDLLCEARIFDNWMNPQDVINFFNKAIYPGAYVHRYYYLELSKQVNKYCKRKLPRFLAFLRNEFTTPWAIISQIVAAILFTLTLLQTVFTISNK